MNARPIDAEPLSDVAAQRERLPWLSRLPSGLKAFLILSFALLPLALIGVFAVLQTTRATEEGVRARLRVAAIESGRRLAIELTGDASALASTLDALALDPADMPSCARVTGVLAMQAADGTRFSVRDSSGKLLCGTGGDFGEVRAVPGAPQVAILPGRGLLLIVAGRDGAMGNVFFPRTFLEKISRAGSDMTDLRLRLAVDDAALAITDGPASDPLSREQSIVVPIGIDGLTLQLTMPIRPITSPVLIAMLLPIMMWLAAAGVTWFAADRLFIRPLRRLNNTLATYTPGEVIRSPEGAGPQAAEIRALSDSFVRLSRTVVDHEAELAEGLVRQTKLTREVHHRVKNNLQVIASLINFHSRGAITPEAAAAYASIQRRVDALAVVQRHYFAEMEISRGLQLRSVISELSANIRATVPDGSQGLGITLETTPFLVSQDTAVAVAFLITEIVELAMSCNPVAQIRLTVQAEQSDEKRATLRVISTALVASDSLESLLAHRYGRVIEGLSRQLRSKLHHDPLTGAFEIAIPVLGLE